MDCSTFSNRTSADDTTVSDESVSALRRQLEASVRSCEATRQELHETKRNYQTALDVQHHLTAELDAQRAGEERRVAEMRARINTLLEEVQDLKTERATATDTLTQQKESLESKIQYLQERLSLKTSEENIPEEKTLNGSGDELIALKNDHNNLMSSVSEKNRQLEEKTEVIASLKERLSELDEKVTWSLEAVDRKKEELESVMEALHSAQSDLALANAELQRMRNDGSNHAAKGNSLFAEVEDKRQEMAKTLIQMKQHNTQLKRELANKQAEIDSLLLEKKTLWEEVSGLSGVLDADMIKSYEQRITELSVTVEQQRCEQARWFSKYYEPGGSQAAEWVAGVLAHLKNRCGKLTDDLLELSVDNLSKASQIRDLHKKVTTLRLKAFEARATQSNNEHTQTEAQQTHIEVEVPPRDLKKEIKMEKQNSLELNATEKMKIVPKKEKSVSDVKKKVTF